MHQYVPDVKRTTISLPEQLAAQAQREARRRSESFSQLVREALRSHLGIGPEGESRPVPIASLGASGEGEVARNAEKILEGELGRAGDR
jgi:Arc/MetJ-type ribon-helix-helix transcriptional regulator